MYHKALTYISRWEHNFAAPVHHEDMKTRAAFFSHKRHIEKVRKAKELQDGIYLVSTPLPEANTPRVITHLFAIEKGEVTGIQPNATPPKVTTWPPK